MGFEARKQGFLAATVLLFSFLFIIVLQSLSRLHGSIDPEIYYARIALCLFLQFLCILGAWVCFSLPGGLTSAILSSILVLFVCWVGKTGVFMWFLAEYFLFCFFLLRLDQFYANQIAGLQVDLEKINNQKNDLEHSFKIKGEGISIFFEKYSVYYNLRKLAEDLASTLSVVEICRCTVQRMQEFIPKGDAIFITLSDENGHLSLLAQRNLKEQEKADDDWRPDLFDHWSLKNRKRLIVQNVLQDFRFDSQEASKNPRVMSLISAPLMNDSRLIGIVRMHSDRADLFTNDDLRVLDTIANLVSFALSNALLYEQTQDLAIRDSLTGLYVRRYFFERLKEEHRRSLMTNRPLSLLMCDLDFFKSCNDRYGHSVGDLMLQKFAQIIKDEAGSGIAGRYGGEEFIILLPETRLAEATHIAESIRAQFESSSLLVRRERIHMTASIGVASMPEDALDHEQLVQRADKRLYEAKQKGRNRVCSKNS